MKSKKKSNSTKSHVEIARWIGPITFPVRVAPYVTLHKGSFVAEGADGLWYPLRWKHITTGTAAALGMTSAEFAAALAPTFASIAASSGALMGWTARERRTAMHNGTKLVTKYAQGIEDIIIEWCRIERALAQLHDRDPAIEAAVREKIERRLAQLPVYVDRWWERGGRRPKYEEAILELALAAGGEPPHVIRETIGISADAHRHRRQKRK